MESGPMEIIKINSSNEIPENFTGITEYPNGTRIWYLNGRLHREDGPAIIHLDGTQFWYLNGKFHRYNGPAIIYSDGYQAWFLKGKRHREDGPAVIKPDGTKAWFLNDKKVPAMEVFNQLPDDKKERELWNLDQWK